MKVEVGEFGEKRQNEVHETWIQEDDDSNISRARR